VFLQEDCARTLLFRGADRCARNQSGQTASQLAIISGNIQLADVIDSFSERDVGKYCTCLLLYETVILIRANLLPQFVSSNTKYTACLNAQFTVHTV